MRKWIIFGLLWALMPVLSASRASAAEEGSLRFETTVPFRPTQGRPVYCRDCFLKMRASATHSVAHAP